MMRQSLTTAALVAAALPLSVFGAGSAGADGERMDISREETRPATPGPVETFTGQVSVKPLFGTVDGRNSSAAEVTFSPSARSAWHTHPAGQNLIVTAGTGLVQEWGQPKQQLRPGDVVWTPAGVKHWHGATESSVLTHIAVQEQVDGSAVDWLEHVSDEQYQN